MELSVEGETLLRVCSGVDPSSLGISRLPDGFLDMRTTRLTQPRTVGKAPLAAGKLDLGYAELRRGKTILRGCALEKADLSDSTLDESIWEKVLVRDVRLHGAKLRNVIFGSGSLERVSFFQADLRHSHWGTQEVDGPTITGADFTGADLRGSTLGHPIFRECRFDNANLKDIDFRGARFERCEFAGLLDGVWFHGWYPDKSPQI